MWEVATEKGVCVIMPLSPRKPDHQIDPSWSLEKRIWWALEAISDRCDGARKLDGAGYSKYDRPIADRLQGLHLSQWSSKDVDEGLHLIRKYRKQLESMGVSIDDIIGDMGMVVMMDNSDNSSRPDYKVETIPADATPDQATAMVETFTVSADEMKKMRSNVALEDDSNSSNEVYCEFLTGSSGTGKTHTIRQRLAEDKNYAMLTSTTGISAINLGTITLNSCLGFFDTESLEESMVKGYLEKRLRDLIESGYKNLVIDEVSMMDKRQLDMIYEGIRRVNERSGWHNKGKLGLVITGDFCQLPVIPPKGEKSIPWAFKADCWDKFESNTIRLTKCWRQSNQKFLEAINFIRSGNGIDGVRVLQDVGVQFHQESDKTFDGTTIIAKNDAVDSFNFIAHSRVNGQMIKVKNTRWGKLRGEWSHVPAELSVKVGAYIMILTNSGRYATNLIYACPKCAARLDGDTYLRVLSQVLPEPITSPIYQDISREEKVSGPKGEVSFLQPELPIQVDKDHSPVEGGDALSPQRELCSLEGGQDSGSTQVSREGVERVRSDITTGPPSSGQSGVCAGTSPGNGEKDREASPSQGTSPSPEQYKGRQQGGKLRVDKYGATSSGEGRVSILPSGVHDKVTCPHCHSAQLEEQREVIFTFVNGDCGHVKDYNSGDFGIELVRNNSIISVGQITRFNYQKDAPRELGEDNRSLRSAYRYDPDSDDIPLSPAFDIKAKKWIVGALTYYPIRLAYATTVHRSQGLSLDKVQIDVNSHFFGTPAMAYVSISRVRTPEGLRIVGDPRTLIERVKIHPEVLKYL